MHLLVSHTIIADPAVYPYYRDVPSFSEQESHRQTTLPVPNNNTHLPTAEKEGTQKEAHQRQRRPDGKRIQTGIHQDLREHGKGWGLIAIHGVKKGDLVQEYAGEIIDEKTKDERLKAWALDHPNDPNFYVMHLEPGWYIDAREVANMARFINHSCNPNCKLVPINVAGQMRVSIVCIKEVPPGGFLCYDYQFDTQHGEKFICQCGAENCCGTMQGRKGEDKIVDKKLKKQLLSEAKSRVQRDKKFLQSIFASEKDRLYLTGPFVPGVDTEKAEMVAGGPREKYRREAQC